MCASPAPAPPPPPAPSPADSVPGIPLAVNSEVVATPFFVLLLEDRNMAGEMAMWGP